MMVAVVVMVVTFECGFEIPKTNKLKSSPNIYTALDMHTERTELHITYCITHISKFAQLTQVNSFMSQMRRLMCISLSLLLLLLLVSLCILIKFFVLFRSNFF